MAAGDEHTFSVGNKRTEQKRRARAKAHGTPVTKIISAGPSHGACSAGVYYSVYKDPASGADIIVCVHSATSSFVSIGSSSAETALALQGQAEMARTRTIQEAREKGLLKEN